MLTFSEYLDEGVNDPSIFKAIFLAGGPGSGKSFMVGRTGLTSLGFKSINSDSAFELALKNAGMKMDPENIASPEAQKLRQKAKELTNAQIELALKGRLGLVIDGTGKDYAKIAKFANNLKKLGYDVGMIFVNTDLTTALNRNSKRARTLPDGMVKTMWKDVQNNIGKFQNLFGDMMIIVDNSEGSNYEGASTSAYKRIRQWASKTPVNKPQVKAWIAAQRS